jgi:IS5 family transposase
MKKILNDLKLKFDNANWALDPELALIDTILEQHPELYEIVKEDIKTIGKDSEAGRQDSPTVEQIVRAALYKEMKKLNYRELEYAQYDSRVCSTFIKLDGRKPISFEAYYKYISQIKGETLKQFMIEINRIMIKEAAVEDCKSLRTDSTVVETDIHYPTNNELTWDCIKTSHRLLKKLEESGCLKKVRNNQKQAKKNRFQINNTKKEDKRKELFDNQLKLLRNSINQAERAVIEASTKGDIKDWVIAEELKGLLPKMEKVHDITRRHELLGEKVPNSEKIFSIYEAHTDIIVKGRREAEFGHKVNLTAGRSNIILDVEIVDGNPKDSQLYEGVLDRIQRDYGVTPRDVVTDGGYASLKNQEIAKGKGVVNIVFNKIVGSLKNITTSLNMETRLKKWRSGIEAVISNVKRGFKLFRCDWKGKGHFDAKVLWSVIAYNIRVMTSLLLDELTLQSQ